MCEPEETLLGEENGKYEDCFFLVATSNTIGCFFLMIKACYGRPIEAYITHHVQSPSIFKDKL